MTEFNFSCFKAYDIRGKIGDELSEELVYNIGKALAIRLEAKKVALGSDVRLTSPMFKQQLAKGLQEMGVDVIDIGTTGTEEIYFATSYLGLDGGVEVTASHNPKDYNGLKIVGKNSVALSYDSGLQDLISIIKTMQVDPQVYPVAKTRGSYQQLDLRSEYVAKVLSFVDLAGLRQSKKLKLLLNPGNGTAGPTLKYIEKVLLEHGANLEFEYLFLEPDGTFPNGIPNPLLVENRAVTSRAIKDVGADLGIAFDGDFDRCFFFDSEGHFIDGYYICGLLAQAFVNKHSGAKIIHEPRLLWNTIQVIQDAGGVPVLSKSGHTFIKAKLRETQAVYGGEMSAHHYFRDYFFCDSGMIPWLLMVELLKQTGKTLAELVAQMQQNFPCSDEINFKVVNASKCIEAIKAYYQDITKDEMTIDGLSYDFGTWRFNVRSSNTEPLLRLNIESRGDKDLVQEKVVELSNIITNA